MANSKIAEQALVKLSEDSSAELTREEAEAVCLDLIDELETEDADLAESIRIMIGRALSKVSQEVMDAIAYKLTIYDL